MRFISEKLKGKCAKFETQFVSLTKKSDLIKLIENLSDFVSKMYYNVNNVF